MSTASAALLTLDRGGAATTGLEGIFAEVLADLLRVDRVPVDSHFFDDLRADSLVMAHFCARVRKRGDLPPVSMRDIYRAAPRRERIQAFKSKRGSAGGPAASTPSRYGSVKRVAL